MKNNNIKKIRLVIILAGIALGAGSSYAQTYQPPNVSTDDNYVLTRTYQAPKNDYSEVTLEGEVIENVNYVDGLGRPRQSVGIGQSPQGDDIVSPIAYDQYGRAKREWLPYVGDSQSLRGAFKPSALSGVQTYYHTNYGTDFPNTEVGNTNPYAEKDYEPSPLNRVLKQAAPGTDWALGSDQTDHAIEFDYGINTAVDAVRYFDASTVSTNNTYTPTLEDGGSTYVEGELGKLITRDENHNGSSKLQTTEEYTDKQGRVVLKRTYANMDLDKDGTIGSGETEIPHDTYYVYDDYGNLTYVLPPKMNASDAARTIANLQADMDDLGYQYVYDYRNRLVEKKIPGKEWEHIVYNKLDQPIMTQDSIQRANNEWLFTKYDAFGRVAYTGKANSAGATTREDIQAEVNVVTDQLWADQSGTSSSFGDANVFYDNGAYPHNGTLALPNPLVTLTEVLTINYYDAYIDAPTGAPGSVVVWGSSPLENNATNVQGLPTVTRVKVLDVTPAQWINTLTYYDDKGMPIYTYSENQYLGTVDIVESNRDFVGKPLKVRTAHTRNGNTIATLDNFEYDHVGRLLKQTQCIGNGSLGYDCNGTIVEPNLVLQGTTVTTDQVAPNSVTISPVTTISGDVTLGVNPSLGGSGGTEELIVFNQYDQLGQLEAKKVGGAPGADYATTLGLQTVDYGYNARGWLKSINQDANTDNDLFNFGINYNTVTHGGTPLYNGNISETEWETSNDNTLRWYTYGYDALNRITSATGSSTNYNLGLVQYDKNGNIERLTRNGHTDVNVTNFGLMDDLTYAYTGNQLQAVDDANPSSALTGFIDGVEETTEYTYDANGNMKTDDNKGITGITYNHLNLPANIAINGNNNIGSISYIYDATGTKLKKTVENITTEYAGNYVYMNNGASTNLQFFSHPEGYIKPDGQGGFNYVYQYKDHLGNIRLSYADGDGDGTITVTSNPSTTEIIEENNYYPFGLKHKGYNIGGATSLANDVAQRWKFGGKEYDESLGLETYDFGARNYDPALGRWMNLDPLAEQMRRHSPYNYAFGNPVYYIDYDGMSPQNNCPTCPPGGSVATYGYRIGIALYSAISAFADLPPLPIEGDAKSDWVSGDRKSTSEEDRVTIVVSDSRGDNNDTTDAPTTFIDGDAIGQAGRQMRTGKNLSKRSKGPSRTGPEKKSMTRDVAETGKKTKSGLQTGNRTAGTMTADNQKDEQQVDTVEYNVTMWKGGQPQGGGGDYGKKNANELKKDFLDGKIFPDLEVDSVSVERAHKQ
jgi:RHS repeat-associated protein